jgi:hypothetical protein
MLPDWDSFVLDDARAELARRSSAGIAVTLLWSPETKTACVAVDDGPADNRFELIIGESDDALDVFLHPYAHAAWRGVNYGLPSDRQAA